MAQSRAVTQAVLDVQTHQSRRLRLRRWVIAYLFIAPTFLFLAYFLYYPAWIALTGGFTCITRFLG